jgi:hypothetical protein
MIFKYSEKFIEANINARGLDHRLIKGFNPNAVGGNFYADIAITK